MWDHFGKREKLDLRSTKGLSNVIFSAANIGFYFNITVKRDQINVPIRRRIGNFKKTYIGDHRTPMVHTSELRCMKGTFIHRSDHTSEFRCMKGTLMAPKAHAHTHTHTHTHRFEKRTYRGGAGERERESYSSVPMYD